MLDFNIVIKNDVASILTGVIKINPTVNSYMTHTHPFNCPFFGTTQVSQYQRSGFY